MPLQLINPFHDNADLSQHQAFSNMNNESYLKVGQVYVSKRTGKKLTVTAVEDNRVYYTVEGFETIAPLFLPKDRFIHLVGLDAPKH